MCIGAEGDFAAAPGDGRSAHVDKFVRDRLPPKALWPRCDFSRLPGGIVYPDRLNCAKMILDDTIERGLGDRPAVHYDDITWSYRELRKKVDAIALVLTQDYGLVPGNRVLLRGPNTPMLVASWLAAVKAGFICVTTMALLRAVELDKIIAKIEPAVALCDITVAAEMQKAAKNAGNLRVSLFTDTGVGHRPKANLDAAIGKKSGPFEAADTAADDPAIAAFTSGTTGDPKCAVHLHRELMSATDCFPRDIWDIQPEHVFSGSPPIAFTYGCGAFIVIPMRYGASIALVSKPTHENLLKTIERHKVTDLYTTPTMYRRMLSKLGKFDISSLRHCNAAGEHLPLDTWERWRGETGLTIIDSIGSTEMFHNFMAAPVDKVKPGSTGRAVAGYQTKLVDRDMNPVRAGEIGALAVRGPNGCLYLDNVAKQKEYVRDGWNLTGDLFTQDEDGYFWYAGRADDLIVSSGYNISGIEIEQILLKHDAVAECAVVSAPDADRGNIVKAFVVPAHYIADPGVMIKELQDFVKASIAPYKYPRAIEFIDALPRTPTGKVQRYKLQQG